MKTDFLFLNMQPYKVKEVDAELRLFRTFRLFVTICLIGVGISLHYFSVWDTEIRGIGETWEISDVAPSVSKYISLCFTRANQWCFGTILVV